MGKNATFTTVYFVRHAQSDTAVRDGRVRPLTEKGVRDAQMLPRVFDGVDVDCIYSSPFKRALDTVRPIAQAKGLDIEVIEDFRERRSDGVQTIPMPELIRKQWRDFSYTLSDGECLGEVQRRNIAALRDVLRARAGNTVLIGTHGMALCTMLKYFNESMGEMEVERILPVMPYIVRMEFADMTLAGLAEVLC